MDDIADHDRPAGVDDATVEAVGTFSEAYEYVVRARGHLYSFHQLIGRADLLFGEAAERMARAGHSALAERLASELVGRNVLDGRWTFQVVEEFDDIYYHPATALEEHVRDELVAGRRHLSESEMKDARRSPDRAGHERRPLAAHIDLVETEPNPGR